MAEIRLAAIRATERKASRGPWQWHWRNDPDAPGSVSMVDQNYAIAMCPRYGASDFAANADFIAMARAAVPELLDLVDRLEAENQQLRDELAQRRQLLTEWMAWWEADDEAPVKLPNALHVRTALTLATPDLVAVSDGN